MCLAWHLHMTHFFHDAARRPEVVKMKSSSLIKPFSPQPVLHLHHSPKRHPQLMRVFDLLLPAALVNFVDMIALY